MALQKIAQQSSTLLNDVNKFGAPGAVDGDKNGNYFTKPALFSCSHTDKSSSEYQWWSVDIGANFEVFTVILTAREDYLYFQLGMYL